MHCAPSVTYPVGRSGFAARLLAGLWLLGAGAVAWWSLWAQDTGWRQGAAIGAAVLSGLVAARAWLRSPVGGLTWDGASWIWRGAGGAVTVSLDLQQRLLLHWEDDSASRWLWLERSSCPERWDDLRRALYSRARIEALPDSDRRR